MARQIMYAVGLLLPDPQQFIDSGFPIRAAKRHDREFFGKIIPVDNAEELNGMSRRTVFPARADVKIVIPYAVFQNPGAILNIYLICVAHEKTSVMVFSIIPQTQVFARIIRFL